MRQLIEFLSRDYPFLHRYLGDIEFGKLVQTCCMALASRPNIRWHSNNLPDLIATGGVWKSRPELSEIAQLERALRQAFDAPDLPTLTSNDPLALEPEAYPQLGFKLHPSVATLIFRTNASSIWSALKCQEEPPEPFHLSEPQAILVWRQGSNARFRALGNEEAVAMQGLAQGLSFVRLCKLIAPVAPDEAVACAKAYLRGWIEAEALLPAVALP